MTAEITTEAARREVVAWIDRLLGEADAIDRLPCPYSGSSDTGAVWTAALRAASSHLAGVLDMAVDALPAPRVDGYVVTERRDGRLMLGDEYTSPLFGTLDAARGEAARRGRFGDVAVVELRDIEVDR
jgi:hypothetical protein